MTRVLTLLWVANVFACSNKAPPPTSNCLDLPPSEGAVVAKVGARGITTTDIKRALHNQGIFANRRYSKPEKLRELVEDRIRFELLVRTGLERGLHRDPEVLEAARNVMVRKLLRTDLDPKLAEENVPDEKVERYYERYKNDYQQPEKLRFAHIQLAPTEEGRALAESLIAKLKDATKRDLFRVYATRHSKDRESRKRGGDVLFISQDEMQGIYGRSFAERLFEATPGELIVTPVQSVKGWHVVKVEAKREALIRSLDEVRRDIRERLLKTERTRLFDQYLTDIRKRYPVAIYEQQLEALFEELAQGEDEEN